jgi:hypothetical protein
MTGGTKMSCSKTEKYSNGAAIATLVLEIISPVFGTHLSTGYIGASTTN